MTVSNDNSLLMTIWMTIIIIIILIILGINGDSHIKWTELTPNIKPNN